MRGPTAGIDRATLLDWFFMAMEATWLLALFDLLRRAGDGAAEGGPVWACLLYPAAYLLGRLGQRESLSRMGRAALLILPAFPAAAWLAKHLLFPDLGWNPLEWTRGDLSGPAWRAWLPVLGWAGFVWLRGVYLAGKRVGFKGLAGGFQMGLVVFFAILPFSGLVGLGPRTLWPLVSGFFVFGLTGLWLAGREGGGPRSRGEGAWPVLVALVLATVLALGFILWSLIDREFLELLAAPLLWLWERFRELLTWLAGLLPRPEPAPLPERPGMGPGLSPEALRDPFAFLARLRPVAEFLFIAAVMSILGMALFRSLTDLVGWFRKRLINGSGPRPVAAEYGLLDDLKALFGGLFRWLKKILGRGGKRPGGEPPISPEAGTVREVYRRFLAWGRSRGVPKAPSITPHEYRNQILKHLPEREEELGLLTEAYVLVRYGRTDPGPDLVALVRRAWQRIRTTQPIQPGEGNRS